MDSENLDNLVEKTKNLSVTSEEPASQDNEKQNYKKSKEYWQEIPPTVNGMLGGFGNVTSVDIAGSRSFLNLLYKSKPAPGKRRALDCGAGIGRITKDLLIDYFDTIDLVEQNANFTAKAEEVLRPTRKLGKIYTVGLQDFKPEVEYDVIWIQWVLDYIKEDDLVEFLVGCTKALSKNGLIIIKENFTKSDEVQQDDKDDSVIRPLGLMKQIIKKANLRIVKEAKQTHFPKCLFPVYMLACRQRKI